MFGISLSEIMVIAIIALVVVGPQKLPGMLRTLGQWVRKLRRLTTEVRAQTGIDEILRQEGIDGVHELRSLLRGEIAGIRRRPVQPREDPYLDAIEFDQGREYPVEGADSYGAMPDDLIDEAADDEAADDEAADDEAADANSEANVQPPDTEVAAVEGGASEKARAQPSAPGAKAAAVDRAVADEHQADASSADAREARVDQAEDAKHNELLTKNSVPKVEASPPKTS